MALSWLNIIYPAPHARMARRLWFAASYLALYAGLVVALERFILDDMLVIHPNIHALLGAVLGLFLGFRTNTAYDRWWEGRKLWGQLVNDSRNLAIKVRAFPKVPKTEREHFGRLIVNFARALKEHLREGIKPFDLTLYKNASVEPEHVPGHIALQIREQVFAWYNLGYINNFGDFMLDRHISSMMDVCGACERIRRTPMATSYLTYIREGIAIYLFTLPWGLVHDFSFWTVPAVMIVSYFMIGIELIAEEVGEPFGRGENDLMLDDICKVIDTTVQELINLPPQR